MKKLAFYLTNITIGIFVALSLIYSWFFFAYFFMLCYPVSPILDFVEKIFGNNALITLFICYTYLYMLSFIFCCVSLYIKNALNWDRLGFYTSIFFLYVFYGAIVFMS